MKALLFLLLIGFIISFNCKLEYISTKAEGKYSSFLWESCSCPTGMTGLIDSYNKKCNCFLKSEISLCKSDSRCEVNYIIGCAGIA